MKVLILTNGATITLIRMGSMGLFSRGRKVFFKHKWADENEDILVFL